MENQLLDISNLTVESDEHGYLYDFTLNIGKGENIVFFGPESSGINVLFPAILSFVDSEKGTILYKEKNVENFDYIELHNYRRDIGYVHSNYGLISNLSVFENIRLPLEYHSKFSEKEIKKRVDGLIFDLNLSYCKRFRPVDLTESETLKTAYARAVALDPDLLFFEHAFDGQSPLNIQTLLEMVENRAKHENKSILIATYEPENVFELGDKFIMLFNGRTVFKGDKNDFLNSKNPYLLQYKNMETKGPMVVL